MPCASSNLAGFGLVFGTTAGGIEIGALTTLTETPLLGAEHARLLLGLADEEHALLALKRGEVFLRQSSFR